MNIINFPKMDRSCISLNEIIGHHNSENRTVNHNNNNNSILPKIMQSSSSNNNGDSGISSENGIIRLDIRPLTLIEKENYQRQLSIRSTTNTNNNPASLATCFEENISDSLEKVQKYHQLLSQKLEVEIHQERLETVSSFVKSLVQRKKDSEIVSHCFHILKKTKDEFETLKKVITETGYITHTNRPLLLDKAVQYEDITFNTKQEELGEWNNQDAINTFFSQDRSSQEVQTISISETKDNEKTAEKQVSTEDDDEEDELETSINTIPETQPNNNLNVVYVSPNDDFILDEKTLKSENKFFCPQNNDTEFFNNNSQSKSTRHVQFESENIFPIPSDNVNDSSLSCPSLISPTHPNRVPLNTTPINIPPIYQEVPADIFKNSLIFTEPPIIKVENNILSSSSTASSIISKYTNYISPQKGSVFSGKSSNKQNLKKIYGQDFIGIQAVTNSQNSSSTMITKTTSSSSTNADSLPFKISKNNNKASPKVLSNSTDDFTPFEIPLQIRSKFRPPFMQKVNILPFQNGNQAEEFHPTVSTIAKKTKRKRLTSIARISPRMEVGKNGKPLVQTVLKFSFKTPSASDVDKKNNTTDEYKNVDGENKDFESKDFVS